MVTAIMTGSRYDDRGNMPKIKSPLFFDVKKTIKCIETDLRWTKAFYYVLYHVLAPINNVNSNNEKYKNIFYYTGQSLDIAIIATLYKIFDKEKQEGLLKLIMQLRHFNTFDMEFFDKAKYDKFITDSEKHIRDIKKIEKQLNPLRNIFRVHNNPNRPVKSKWLWTHIKLWSEKAETIFGEALAVLRIPYAPYSYDDFEKERKLLFQNLHLTK